METEDFVTAALRYRHGALGVIEATTAALPGYPERIEVMGDKGSASLVGTALQVSLIDGRAVNMASDATAGGTGADPMAFPHDYHRALIANFLDALEGGRDPEVTGEEALKVHFLIDALLESGASGRPAAVCSDD
jgi:predicted dehydrogenase